MKLDTYDRKIMNVLSVSGRIPWRELADTVGLSLTPTLRRVRLLEKAGYIERYTVALSANKLIGGISVVMTIALDRQSAEAFAKFETGICDFEEVVHVAMLSGSIGYSIHLVCPDMPSFQRLFMRISGLPHVKHIESNFVMKIVLRRPMLPPLTVTSD